jgi:hypothetical protein
MKKLVHIKNYRFGLIFMLLIWCNSTLSLQAQSKVAINWNKVIKVSKTIPTLQVVYNPMLDRDSPIHNGSFQVLKNLGANYVRFVPWFPYPYAAVAELKPPTKDSTFWDFSKIDPVMEDFMKATKSHSVVMNFSTIPDWMFETKKPVEVPSNPDQVFWGYNKGTVLKDTTLKQLTDYFVRVFKWYTKGGFTDELGNYHKSGYHYKFQYWEVLNEMEHHLSPQLYTRIYDAVVMALKKISPSTKFIGLALGSENNPEYFKYFLNHKNHNPGAPLDGISYHFYAHPLPQDKSINDWQYSFFEQANNFLVKVRYIEAIRRRLSPNTFSDLDELGVILGDQTGKNIQNPAYWNLAGAMYAYLYVELSKIGINVAGESQLVGYPSQYPSVSMMDWTNGKPNARYWVLKLLKDNFGPDDKLVSTRSGTSRVTAQAFITPEGRRLLLINKRNMSIQLMLPTAAKGAQVMVVNVSTEDNPPIQQRLLDNNITLKPFSVAVVHLK